MPAGKLTLEEIPQRESVTTVSTNDKSGYASVSEINDRYAAVLGIQDQLPTSNTESEKTVSTESSGDFASASTRFQGKVRTSDQPVLIFPADLTKSEKNKHWTKITVYEVFYNKDYNKGNTSNVYVGGKKENVEFYKDGSGNYKALVNAYGNTNIQNNANSETLESSATFSNYGMVNKTIALPYPDTSPQWEFATPWTDSVEWGATAGIVEALAKGKNGDIEGAIGEIADQALRFFRHIIREMPITGKLTSASTRMSVTPRTEMMFGGNVDVRRPSFQWKLFPKNQKEAETLMDIVDTLKSFVLPSYMETGGAVGSLNKNQPNVDVLVFPAVFEICFMHGSNENKSMPRFGPLGCSNFQITPISERWHAHRDGSPVSFELNMQFTELFPVIRDHLNEDGNTSFYVR